MRTVRTVDVSVIGTGHVHRRQEHPVLAVVGLAIGLCFLVVAWKIAVPALILGLAVRWLAGRRTAR
jgi:hypothetical protein